jgi:Na+/H+-dicarboxylate symporter
MSISDDFCKNSPIVGFFSYARSDDKHTDDKLSQLGLRISKELGVLLGCKLKLWQDTKAIPYGTKWEEEIKAAIAESVFFIPIVSPAALRSEYCRMEFEAFLARERALGRNDLVFPIIYAPVHTPENADQEWALNIINARQCADWTKLRLQDVQAPEVTQAIHKLCEDIVKALRKCQPPPIAPKRETGLGPGNIPFPQPERSTEKPNPPVVIRKDEPTSRPVPKNSIFRILVATVLGIAFGVACHEFLADQAQARACVVAFVGVGSGAFLALIRAIFVPLVLSTLISSIIDMGREKDFRPIVPKTMVWFVVASLASLALGTLMAYLPGLVQSGAMPTSTANAPQCIPMSAADASQAASAPLFNYSALYDLLLLPVGAILIAIALLRWSEPDLEKAIKYVRDAMLGILGHVVKAAPVAVFCAIAAAVTARGLNSLNDLIKFALVFYAALGILWGGILVAGHLMVGPRIWRLIFGLMPEPLLLAFTTASSDAAYSETKQRLEQFGVPSRVAEFVLSLGYPFNLDGSTMYCAFATLYIAQASGSPPKWWQLILMLALLWGLTKGMSGVPRASLVVISATLSTFGIPETRLMLIVGIDQFLDMGRSATNLLGNSVAAAAITKWEGKLNEEGPAPGERRDALDHEGDGSRSD